MRRLLVDQVVSQSKEMKAEGDEKGFKRNIELLQTFACSISATIQPGDPRNPFKLVEIKYISDQIQLLLAL